MNLVTLNLIGYLCMKAKKGSPKWNSLYTFIICIIFPDSSIASLSFIMADAVQTR